APRGRGSLELCPRDGAVRGACRRRRGHLGLGGLAERLDLARGALERNLTGERHERREVGKRHVAERLEQLLIAPAALARLLVEVHRHLSTVLEQLLEITEQALLLFVPRSEAP